MRITEKELTNLREEQELFMPDIVTIKRQAYAGDDEWEQDTIAANVPARIVPGYGFWRSVADRFQGITAYTITLPWDQDIQSGDVLVTSATKAFEVRAVRAPSTYQTAKQVLVDGASDA